jgi:hypothetical protein
MTPQEKANQLANKFVFKSIFDMTDLELIEDRQKAKKSALISVDEILKECIDIKKRYWQQVKQEIQAL